MNLLKTMFVQLRAGNLGRLFYIPISLILLFVIVKLRNIVHDEGVLTLSLMGIVSVTLLLATFVLYFAVSVMRAKNLGFYNPKLFCYLTFIFGWGVSTFNGLFAGYEILILNSLSCLSTSFLMISMCILFFSPENFVHSQPIRVLFWDLKKGELRRLPFLGYLMLGMALWSGAILYSAQMWSLFKADSTGFLILSVFLIYMFHFYITFVLCVKRVRNIGSNFAVIIVCILFSFLFIFSFLTLSNGPFVLFYLFLLCIPESSSRQKSVSEQTV